MTLSAEGPDRAAADDTDSLPSRRITKVWAMTNVGTTSERQAEHEGSWCRRLARFYSENWRRRPDFNSGMEVLQIQRGRASCCLVLVSGLSSSPVLPGVRAVLDYVWTIAPGGGGGETVTVGRSYRNRLDRLTRA